MLVGGMLRQHAVAVKSWNILESLDVDLYYSTWDISRETNPGLGVDYEYKVTQEHILPTAKHAVIHDTLAYNYNSNFRRQMHHWQTLISAVTDIYDVLIITRPDLHFTIDCEIFSTFLSTVEDNIIYTLYQKPSINHIDDLMLIGRPSTLKNFILNLDLSDVDHTTFCHNWLYNAIKKNMSIENVAGVNSVALCRATCNLDDSFDVIVKKAKEWQIGLGLE